MFVTLLAVVLLSSPDAGAGVARVSLPTVLDHVFRTQHEPRKTEALAALRAAAAKDTGDEKQGAFLVLPSLARSAGLDTKPLRREALTVTRDLVERFPGQGAAHDLRATALSEARASSRAVLDELEQCARLEPQAPCARSAADVRATLERPRCSGSALKAELLVTGAQQEWMRAPGAAKGTWTDVREKEPFLRSADFSSVSVDAQGNLLLEVTEAAKARLEKETRRLVGTPAGAVVLTLGSEVLLSARVQEPIAEGRIQVSRGLDKAPFRIESLCKTVERPTVP